MFAAAPGDGRERGLNQIAIPGLIRRAIGGHWSLVPKLGKLALDGEIEAYNLPLGCIAQLYRDIAAHRAGLLSRVGLRTFVDPRLEGGKLNARTTEDLVELHTIGGQEYLLYKAFPIQVALIRGTTADTAGNLTMEREALTLDALPAAMAAQEFPRLRHRPGGTARPGRLARRPPGSGPRRAGRLRRPRRTRRTTGRPMEASITAPFPARSGCRWTASLPLPLDERKVIARRAALELPPGGVVNLGIGMPEGVAAVAAEEKSPALRHPDRRTRRDRRHAAGRPELRRRAEPGRRHPAEPAIRLL